MKRNRSRRIGFGAIVGALISAFIVIVTVTAPSASAAPPAAFTTNADGSAVNANHYQDKCDVYINGGPVSADVGDGSFVFAVLAPSGQADPNGPDLLSTDSNANRTFTSNGGSVSYGGTHTTSTDAVTGGTLIDLCDYDDTPNPGGVYILAICHADNLTPSGCKYDAFKVEGDNPPEGGTDLVATKTAVPSFTRSYTWTSAKSTTTPYLTSSGNTVTAQYSATITKSAASDSNFVVSGTVDVFNPNDDGVSGVAVTDSIGSVDCAVSGGSSTIPAGGSTQFSYSCTLPNATATSSGTNTAVVTWDAPSVNSPNASTNATAPYDFSTATPTVVGDSTNVSDTLAGSFGTIYATTTFPYTVTLNVPASGCTTYTNTVSESTSGTSASANVTVCRTNSNGFTIGYWQNKNGQAYIQANAAALCTYLSQYSNILTGLPSCSGANIAGNSTRAGSLAKYVYDTIKAANSAGDGVLMLKAQFMATAINVYQTPALGTTNLALSTSRQNALNLGACSSVNNILTAENSRYPIYSGTKSVVVDLQSLNNAINNNAALTC
jgi:hypothetical protein